jgi:hypothetical protein
MSQVLAHPWFQTSLPCGALAMNATILADAVRRAADGTLSLHPPPEVLAALVRVSGGRRW